MNIRIGSLPYRMAEEVCEGPTMPKTLCGFFWCMVFGCAVFALKRFVFRPIEYSLPVTKWILFVIAVIFPVFPALIIFIDDEKNPMAPVIVGSLATMITTIPWYMAWRFYYTTEDDSGWLRKRAPALKHVLGAPKKHNAEPDFSFIDIIFGYLVAAKNRVCPI